jgi:hypothetical protein
MLGDFSRLIKKIEILFRYERNASQQHNNMSATSNNTILADNEPSICIPRVFANIDRKRIHNVFQSLFGPDAISQIDMVKRTSENGEEYNRVFLHFNKWPKTLDAQKVRQKLLSGEKVKVVYDEPWFWYMSASKVERPQPRSHRSAPSPYIDLTEDHSSRSQIQIKGDKREREREREREWNRERDYRSQGPPQQQHRGGGASAGNGGKYYQEERHQPHPERYGSYERPRADFYYEHYEQRRPQQQQQQYREREGGRRNYQSYQPKFQREQGRPPKTPEIAEWMEEKGKKTTVPGAPVKSVKPKLMLEEDEHVPSTTARSLKTDMESAAAEGTETMDDGETSATTA